MSDRCPKCGSGSGSQPGYFACNSLRSGQFVSLQCRDNELENLRATVAERDATIAGLRRKSQEIIDLLRECRLQYRRGETSMHKVTRHTAQFINQRIDAAIKQLEQEDRE